jgi:protein-tyrosine-phosphatase
MHIHFICRGNILRSLIAETYVNSLGLPNVTASSSGTNVDFSLPEEQEYFRNSLQLLQRHGISQFVKPEPQQLTQDRIANTDLVVIVNQRAYDEAKRLVTLPKSAVVWNVVDIGEGDRVATSNNRHDLEELIYQELTTAVDELLAI